MRRSRSPSRPDATRSEPNRALPAARPPARPPALSAADSTALRVLGPLARRFDGRRGLNWRRWLPPEAPSDAPGEQQREVGDGDEHGQRERHRRPVAAGDDEDVDGTGGADEHRQNEDLSVGCHSHGGPSYRSARVHPTAPASWRRTPGGWLPLQSRYISICSWSRPASTRYSCSGLRLRARSSSCDREAASWAV